MSVHRSLLYILHLISSFGALGPRFEIVDILQQLRGLTSYARNAILSKWETQRWVRVGRKSMEYPGCLAGIPRHDWVTLEILAEHDYLRIGVVVCRMRRDELHAATCYLCSKPSWFYYRHLRSGRVNIVITGDLRSAVP